MQLYYIYTRYKFEQLKKFPNHMIGNYIMLYL